MSKGTIYKKFICAERREKIMEPNELIIPIITTTYVWYATFSSTAEADVKTFINEHKEDLMKLNDFVFGLNCDNTVSAEKDNRISIRVVRSSYSIDSCKEIAEKVKQYIKDNISFLRISYQYLGECSTYAYEDETSAVENNTEEGNNE